MKEAEEPGSVKGAVVMTTEYHDDFNNTDTSDIRTLWTKEPELGKVDREKWKWAGPVLCAAVLLALIISVSISNIKTDNRFSSVEKIVANLSSVIQTTTTALEHSKASVSEKMKGINEVESLRSSIANIKCTLQRLLNNGTSVGCCPLGWVVSGSSCYFFSSDGLPWNQARDYCFQSNAQLAVLKTPQDWDFVTSHTMPLFYWLGLSDERTGNWEWIDGTPYIMDRSQWKPGQPDNWKGHGLGGTEDCAMIHSNGQLNDDHCTRSYRYVCQGHTMKPTQ
uniref:C-type lectin domain-containing protein n=1 Tax=Esox lucius TaxID=8010 RepID=A0AAY5L7B5_ESOLU